MSYGRQSYDVRIWGIEPRGNRYRVRWAVEGHRQSRTFVTRELADSFRSELKAAARSGEAFDTETGLPQSMLRQRRDVSCLTHAREFVASAWPNAAAKTRVSILETLSVALPVLTRDLSGAPDRDVLRLALRKELNQNAHARPPDADERRALAWLERASLPVSSLEDGVLVSDMLDTLARCLDGSPAAPDYFSRRRRVMHRVLGYAVRKKRLEKNPLGKGNLPEGWTPPDKPEDAVDPRSVGSPELIAGMLTAATYVGRRQGQRFAAFYGCMFYAMMRPAEVTALTRDGCHLPETGWGRLIFADSTPTAGREFTDDGRTHEDRGLKGRDRHITRARQARARRPTRNVPIPPELVRLLREHIERFGTTPDGHLFRSENGNPIQASTSWQVWQKIRALSLTPQQLASPLMRRPYDLRHSGITWRLNSGVPPTEIAAWAGHSVEVLMRVYARCVAGMEDVWISRMDTTLHQSAGRPPHEETAVGDRAEPEPAAAEQPGDDDREADGNGKGAR